MKSQLTLSTEYKYDKTNIKDLFCNPPYRIMSPFMDGDKMEVCLMSSSAGFLGGDEFSLRLEVGDNCNLTFVSQSYEKILDTGDKQASKLLDAWIGNNALLKYVPYPAIPFAGSKYEAKNTIHLSGDSTFVYSDIFSCGRVGMGERYGLKSYKAYTKVFVDNALAYADNTMIVPDRINYSALGLWGEYTHNSMLYIYSPNEEVLKKIVEEGRNIATESEIYSGITYCAKGIVMRSMGYSGEELYKLNKKIAALV